jgi:hypothetical protein
MATPQPVPAPTSDLQINAVSVQVGNEIKVLIQIGDRFGLSMGLCWPIDVARNFSKAIKNAVEQAETTIVKPPSAIVPG